MPSLLGSPHVPPLDLLQETLRCFVHPQAQAQDAHELSIAAGGSGAPIHRYRVRYATAKGKQETSLIVKEATLLERKVALFLSEQGRASVPFCYTGDLTTDAPAPLCLQDLGSQHRPPSLAPIAEELRQKEAQALGTLHQINANQGHHLSWLPRFDRDYLATQLHYRFWMPWWKVTKESSFVHQFRSVLARIEARAECIVDEMESLCQQEETLTLIHGDLHPGNVLFWQQTPFFIDWETAHYGPCYVDLPKLFFPLECAEPYREARSGWHIPRATFEECYRITARYIGLRQTWAFLQPWYQQHANTALADYFIRMILS